jgi:hypothetical protein
MRTLSLLGGLISGVVLFFGASVAHASPPGACGRQLQGAVVQQVPELDGSSAAMAAAMIAGGLALATSRRGRRGQEVGTQAA